MEKKKKKRRRVVNPVLVCRPVNDETVIEYTTSDIERNRYSFKSKTNVKINTRVSKLKSMFHLFD